MALEPCLQVIDEMAPQWFGFVGTIYISNRLKHVTFDLSTPHAALNISLGLQKTRQ